MARPTVRDVHVDGPLSQISIAYKNTEYIADRVFPIVTVEHKSDVYYTFEKGAWFRDRAKHRAPGTRAARADYALDTASYICLPYAMAKEVTDEELDNADAPLRPLIDATEFATDGILLAREIRVANLITACANWASASVPSTVWSSDTSDPFGDIDTLQNAIRQSIGRKPNKAVLGWNAWRQLRQHPDFVDRVKHTRAGGRVEPGDLMAWFGYEEILIGEAIQETADEGQTSSISDVWGDVFWSGFVPRTAGLKIPAAGYIFTWGARKAERFEEDQEHQTIVAVEEHSDEVITASDAGGGFYGVV